MDDQSLLQYAHVNIPAMYGLDATLDFFERIGWDAVYGRVRELGRHLLASAALRRLDLVTPADAHAGIFVVRCANDEAAQRTLAGRGVSVAARGYGLRVSPHFYNTADEIDRGLAAIAELIEAT